MTQNEDNLNDYFTEEEILSVVMNLPMNKACGVDEIINEYIKLSVPLMLPVFKSLFNIILDTGHVPNDLTIGIIKPLFKNKGDVSSPENYRGITLLSCLGKMFTAVINKRLTKFLDQRQFIGEEQVGFRKGYGPNDHIFVLKSIIDLYLSKKWNLNAVFVDYKTAFDQINRTTLWHKIINSGINGKIFRKIVNLYSNAHSCLKMMEYCPNHSHVPQESTKGKIYHPCCLPSLSMISKNTYQKNMED